MRAIVPDALKTLQPHRLACAADAPLLAEHSQTFLAYWSKIRGSAAMPRACDINPSDFVSLMPYMRYMRQVAPETVVFRVWGTKLTEWMGIDLTGINVFDYLPPEERAAEAHRLRILHDIPCGFVQQREVTDTRDIVHRFEFLTLPVGPGPDGARRFIGPGSLCDDVPSQAFELGAGSRTFIKAFSYLDIGFGVPTSVPPACIASSPAVMLTE